MKPYPTLTYNLIESTYLEDLERSSESVLMQDIFEKVMSLAQLDTPVVVIGEIGSGKKRLAKLIHENSDRADGPFHTYYCVDVNEEEIKEAFWERIEFDDDHIVLKYDVLEKATGGILYLDQFSELPPKMMLEMIQSLNKGIKQIFRYDRTSRPRLIISLNQESFQKIMHTPIWDTILQELDPFVIMLPPLRERREDIPIIIDFILEEIKEVSSEWENLSISPEAKADCFNYHWPGNIRQLKNAIMQGAILYYGQTIESDHLPFSMSWKLPYEMRDKTT
jgi:DNA-binding NtrC family response regulator